MVQSCGTPPVGGEDSVPTQAQLGFPTIGTKLRPRLKYTGESGINQGENAGETLGQECISKASYAMSQSTSFDRLASLCRVAILMATHSFGLNYSPLVSISAVALPIPMYFFSPSLKLTIDLHILMLRSLPLSSFSFDYIV